MTRFLFIALIFMGGCAKTITTDNEVTPVDNVDNESATSLSAVTPTTATLTPFATEMLTAVNVLRAKGCNCGTQVMPPVPALKWNSLLEAASVRHARDMATTKKFSHTGSDGSTMQTRINATGYRWSTIGENIAWGYTSVTSVMAGWTKSAGHCKNMMSANFTEIGAARNANYWVQDFGKPR